MIIAILLAESIQQARTFAREELNIDAFGRFMCNAAVVTRDDSTGGANACVLGLDKSVPFYVIGADTEQRCVETIKYLAQTGHPRGVIDDSWFQNDTG